jgi:hypothetical protein
LQPIVIQVIAVAPEGDFGAIIKKMRIFISDLRVIYG